MQTSILQKNIPTILLWSVVLFFFFFFLLLNRVSLCSPGCTGAHSIDQASKSRDPPATVSLVLKIKVFATTAPSEVLVLHSVTVGDNI